MTWRWSKAIKCVLPIPRGPDEQDVVLVARARALADALNDIGQQVLTLDKDLFKHLRFGPARGEPPDEVAPGHGQNPRPVPTSADQREAESDAPVRVAQQVMIPLHQTETRTSCHGRRILRWWH